MLFFHLFPYRLQQIKKTTLMYQSHFINFRGRGRAEYSLLLDFGKILYIYTIVTIRNYKTEIESLSTFCTRGS
jgi:hypothetical protein